MFRVHFKRSAAGAGLPGVLVPADRADTVAAGHIEAPVSAVPFGLLP